MLNLLKRNPGKSSVAVAVAAALALIVPWEGFEPRAYKDIVGVWTYCYGETTNVDRSKSYTKAQCLALAESRVTKDYYQPLTLCIKGFTSLPVGVQAAGTSLAYNVGVGATCKSTFARLAERGHIKEACDALLKFNKAGGKVVKGLVNRRTAERKVCLEGNV